MASLTEADIEAAVLMILGDFGYAVQGSATIAPDLSLRSLGIFRADLAVPDPTSH